MLVVQEVLTKSFQVSDVADRPEGVVGQVQGVQVDSLEVMQIGEYEATIHVLERLLPRVEPDQMQLLQIRALGANGEQVVQVHVVVVPHIDGLEVRQLGQVVEEHGAGEFAPFDVQTLQLPTVRHHQAQHLFAWCAVAYRQAC